MILRVYAMYHRSRIVLWILLLVYIPAMTIQLVLTPILNNTSTHLFVSELEEFNVKLCVVSFSGGKDLHMYINIARTVVSVVLCFFAIAQFIGHSRVQHEVFGRWQANRYMKLLAQQSILYFIVNLIYNVVGLIESTSTMLVGPAHIILVVFVAPYILGPRLIIGVREFHSRTVGEHIDSGFGWREQHFWMRHTRDVLTTERDGGLVEDVADDEAVFG